MNLSRFQAIKSASMRFLLFQSLVTLLSIAVQGQVLNQPHANSEPIFGEYTLSRAADSRVCPKKLVVRDLQPYVPILKTFTLPVSHFVFDGKQCTKGNESLILDFGGDNDGSDETLPAGTCLDKTVVAVVGVSGPGKFPNGTFGFFDPNKPLVSNLVIGGDCASCFYSKPFFGDVEEGYPPFQQFKCAGRKVYPPIKGFGFKAIQPPRYFINVKCLQDGTLWVRGGVVHTEKGEVEDGSKIEISVESNGNVYSVKSQAFCSGAFSSTCVDWRTWHRDLLVPKSSLKQNVQVVISVDNRQVKVKRFEVRAGCDRWNPRGYLQLNGSNLPNINDQTTCPRSVLTTMTKTFGLVTVCIIEK